MADGEEMNWIENINKTLEYIENHIYEDISMVEIAKAVNISPFYLQKGFSLIVGFGVKEYIRNRRLFLSALELSIGKVKVIDIAYKYFYETPESFTKAFTRFHGVSPSAFTRDPTKIRVFLPMHVELEIKGGYTMNAKIEQQNEFSVIGFRKSFNIETSYNDIPLFWDEIMQTEFSPELKGIIKKFKIGELGLCHGCGCDFDYFICGFYDNSLDTIPKELEVLSVRSNSWAKFECVGPIPVALQSINTKIFKEWLPSNANYEMADELDIEWYDSGDTSADDYHSEIWIPVKTKKVSD